MNFLIAIQSWALEQSPSLLPGLSIVYSFLSSIHCSVMCSPLIPQKDSEKYYVGRLASYTSMGLLLGGLGNLLMKSLEFKALAVIAFFVFLLITLVALGYSGFVSFLVPKKRKLSKSIENSFLRGLFSAFIPCHLLYFFYSLAILSGTFFGGGIILFGHAVVSMPALVYGKKLLSKMPRMFSGKWAKKLVKALILGVCLLNLAYFGSRIFNSDEEAKSKVLFCI